MNFKEVPDSSWFKFDKHGDVIEGLIERIWTQTGGEYGDRKVADIKTSDGALWSVTATGELKSKIQKLSVGQYVRLTYVGDRQGNSGAFKSIKVEVAEGSPAASERAAPPAANANGQQSQGGKAPF